jgi:hypothetical protein
MRDAAEAQCGNDKNIYPGIYSGYYSGSVPVSRPGNCQTHIRRLEMASNGLAGGLGV